MARMIIALGTTSDTKRAIFESASRKMDFNYSGIISINVESGIPDQPLDEQTTIQGAMNRASNALVADDSAQIGVGLEAGLEKINGVYHLVCVAAIRSTDNSNYIGVSGKVALPKQVSDAISRGGTIRRPS